MCPARGQHRMHPVHHHPAAPGGPGRHLRPPTTRPRHATPHSRRTGRPWPPPGGKSGASAGARRRRPEARLLAAPPHRSPARCSCRPARAHWARRGRGGFVCARVCARGRGCASAVCAGGRGRARVGPPPSASRTRRARSPVPPSPPEPCRAGRFEPRPGAGPKMISRGSWRLSRKCANGKPRRPLAAAAAGSSGIPEPARKACGAARAGRGPASWRGLASRRASRVTCARRRGPRRPLPRCAHACRPPGGGNLETEGTPGPPGREASPPPALGAREGGSGRPQKPFRFVQVT